MVLLPCPSLPSDPKPHVYNVPSLVSAAECNSPHFISIIFSFISVSTILGYNTSNVLPCPNLPSPPYPQLYSLPSLVRANVCDVPNDIY